MQRSLDQLPRKKQPITRPRISSAVACICRDAFACKSTRGAPYKSMQGAPCKSVSTRCKSAALRVGAHGAACAHGAHPIYFRWPPSRPQGLRRSVAMRLHGGVRQRAAHESPGRIGGHGGLLVLGRARLHRAAVECSLLFFLNTFSISNYKTFDFFSKFDYLFYLKNCVKYYIFSHCLLY